MGMPAEARRRWTAREVAEMQQEDRAYPRYELVDGELLVTPSPGDPHQGIVGELYFQLAGYLRTSASLKVWLSPADIRLEPESIVQPDIFIAPRALVPMKSWADIKSLVLVVEALSPSTGRQDRTLKRRFYQRHNVSEYWIVDTEHRRIERWHPADAEPTICADRLEWQAPGAPAALILDLREVFHEALRL